MSDKENELIERLRALAPWHQNLDLGNGIFTEDGNRSDYSDPDLQNVSIVKVQNFKSFLNRIYEGGGLKGKRVVDIGCNAGGYCITAHQLGAKYCLGFDPREHWIDQANFLKEHFKLNDDQVQFSKGTLDEMLPDLPLFDLTIFKGVFYHIPYPVYSLVQLCRHTKEIIIVDTAMRNDIPEDCMVAQIENVNQVMSGVDGLAWLAGGPKVVQRILLGCGFEYSAVTKYVEDTSTVDQRKNRKPSSKIGRFRIVAARTPLLFEAFGDLDVRK